MDKINRAAPPPCRLYGFLAMEAPIGVILRRGPSKFVQLIKWSTDNDTFEMGQWFKGRIYEYRSDLSADGLTFLYHARKEDRVPNLEENIGYDWTALSKPPYFTALAVWGLGVTNDNLDNGVSTFQPNKGGVPGDWKFRGSKHEGWTATQRDELHEKNIPSTECVLIRNSLLGRLWGQTRIRYSVRDNAQDSPLERADWADVDQRGRLVFTRDGKVYACDPGRTDIDEAIELADFNASTFEPIAAPEWAKTW